MIHLDYKQMHAELLGKPWAFFGSAFAIETSITDYKAGAFFGKSPVYPKITIEYKTCILATLYPARSPFENTISESAIRDAADSVLQFLGIPSSALPQDLKAQLWIIASLPEDVLRWHAESAE